MTEITVIRDTLPPAIERFVLHWGDLGSVWGVNRSVSQIHALLYVAERPVTAEDIADTLGMARSNVSNSLKELMAWRLVRRTPVLGDRRDHFIAETDVWEMVMRIIAGRKERELDPAARALRQCVEEAEGDKRVSALAAQRLAAMLDFVESVSRWYEQMATVPQAKIVALIKLGTRVVRLLDVVKRKRQAR